MRLKLPKSCSNGLFSTAILQPELKLHETSLCSALSSAALAEEIVLKCINSVSGMKGNL